MRYAIIVVGGLCAVMLAGCVPSLHPLYTDDVIVLDSLLAGSWVNEGGNETWEFYDTMNRSYELFYTEDEVPAHFETHLVRLGDYLFLDTYPDDDEIENDFYKLHLVPAHIFGRVWISLDTLRLSLLDADWLKKNLEKGSVKLAHEIVDGSLVLTAEPEKLQAFAKKYADDPDAFAEPTVLTRQY